MKAAGSFHIFWQTANKYFQTKASASSALYGVFKIISVPSPTPFSDFQFNPRIPRFYSNFQLLSNHMRRILILVFLLNCYKLYSNRTTRYFAPKLISQITQLCVILVFRRVEKSSRFSPAHRIASPPYFMVVNLHSIVRYLTL